LTKALIASGVRLRRHLLGGLKLEPMKRKVQVMIIDHIEQKPNEN
jgi:uncharacterized protein (TIGR03435 family)